MRLVLPGNSLPLHSVDKSAFQHEHPRGDCASQFESSGPGSREQVFGAPEAELGPPESSLASKADTLLYHGPCLGDAAAIVPVT